MDTQLRFGPFELCPVRRQLLVDDDRPVSLGARAFDLLSVLIANRDRVMSKCDLMDRVWPDTVVEENNLSVQVSMLRKVLGDAAIATISGRGYKWALPVVTQPDASASGRAKPSIAVLPFANLSGLAENSDFVDGLAEDIVAGLSHSRWLCVVASSSSQQFRDPRAATDEVCRMLGVQYLLRGTVRSIDHRLRVAVELVDGIGNGVVWAERYDPPSANRFAIQDEIAGKIAGAVEPACLKHEQQRSLSRPG